MLLQSIPIKVTLANLKSSCAPHELRLPMGFSAGDTEWFDRIANMCRKNKRGDYLHCNGQAFASLHAIKSGFLKTCNLGDEGQEKITSFYMTGGRPVLIDMLSPCGSGRACGRHGRY